MRELKVTIKEDNGIVRFDIDGPNPFSAIEMFGLFEMAKNGFIDLNIERGEMDE